MGLDGKRVWSIAGGAFDPRGNLNTLAPGDVAIPVTSVFARTGNIVAAQADYAPYYSGRDPIWDMPSGPVGSSGGPSVDDDEFHVDSLASGVWQLIPEGGGAAFTRDGEVDLTANVAASHYRSSCIGGSGGRRGTLLVQVPIGQACVMFKSLQAALSDYQLWYVGAGLPFDGGTGVANNPKFGLALWRNNAGQPDFNNVARIRTGSNPDVYQMLTTTGGATVSNVSSGTFAPTSYGAAGLFMRANHGSAAANNFGGGIFSRVGAAGAVGPGNSVQFNAATDKVGFYMQSSIANQIVGSSTLFTLHFFRRVSLATGAAWIVRQ